MSLEGFEKMVQSAHCGHWDFDSLLLWYYEAKQTNAQMTELIEFAINAGFIRHSSACPMNAFYGKEKCDCGFNSFLLKLELFLPRLRKEREESEAFIKNVNNKDQ